MEKELSLSTELRSAVSQIKVAILHSQYNAARGVNQMQLSLYYGIGKYISEHSRQDYWGTGAIDKISIQLQKELPGLRGFGPANLKFMRQFYEAWQAHLSLSPASSAASVSLTAVSETSDDINPQLLLASNRYPSVSEMDEFLSIGFTHHMIIIRGADTLEERLFYIHQTYINRWSKHRLQDMMHADLFHHQGELPNNFARTMPSSRSALQAIEMFKDEYLLDYINVEQLGERDLADVDERVVEKAIIHNVKNFIMTFGSDFTFVGNQYHLEKFGHHSFPDLLFYNRELAALVVVELKRGEFKPAYLGQLSAYLRILDSEVKKPFENPSIGIILCKQADKSYVEFLIQGYENPMGVATYKTADDVRKALPSEDALRRLIDQTP